MKLLVFIINFGVYFFYCRISASAEIPNCAFEDTVNLTSSEKLANGSYLYESVLVPPALTGYYEYVELYDGKIQQVEKHIRGCVCHLKSCVKFCCHPRSELQQKSENSPYSCKEELFEELNYSPLVNITLHNNSRALMNVLDEFVVQQGIPCNGYMLEPHNYLIDKWELFENGTLLRTHFNKFLSKRDYCLQAYKEEGKYLLNPMNCEEYEEESPPLEFNTYVMLISEPFLYATILVHWLIPELWNLHTKCLISYLLSLAVGTTLIVIVNMMRADFENTTCAIIGFVMYYFLTAVFFWLNIICFDIWHNFRGSTGNAHHLTQRKRFRFYCLYGWGVPLLMTIVTAALQYSDISDDLKSGIGYSHCALKTEDWSAMIYFFGPCLLLVILNIVMFYLTAKRIYSIRRELRKFSQVEDRRRHLRLQQNDLWLFLRMFIIMGIGWLMEIVGYMLGDLHGTSTFEKFAEFYNGSQGLLIFVVLVMKKKVLLLIKKRILCIESPEPIDSTESQCSEEEMTLQNVAEAIPKILR